MIVIIFDAKDMIFGRLATKVAKEALLGNQVVVVNTRHICIAGKKKNVIEKFRKRFKMGHPTRGPFYPKAPGRLFKRMMRGMLPYKKDKGKKALSRVRCYSDIPKTFEGKEFVRVEGADINKLPTSNYVRLGEISRLLGGIQ
jgi:large subunit ribosomal protein L13